MSSPEVLLVHGAATTATVWSRLLVELAGLAVTVVDRPCSGDLHVELAALRDRAEGAVLVGVGGGATLGLALLAAGVPLAGAVLHEPAAGSLVPGLLDDVAAAYRAGGTASFAAALYGPSWTPGLAPADDSAVERDLRMFRAFEPAPPTVPTRHARTTVGELSPPARHRVARALTEHLGLAHHVLPGSHHAVHLDAPHRLALVVRRTVDEAGSA